MSASSTASTAANGITEMIRRRRTIKPAAMAPRPIDGTILEEILENANWAPTHGLTEPWRFFVFQADARQRLAEHLAETYRRIVPAEEFKQKKYDGHLTNPTLAPVVIVIGMQRQASGKISELDEIAAVACAVQNMHLTATARGIGGFWSSNVAACSEATRDFVGLGEADRVLGLFYLGYPQTEWPTGQRTPIADKVSYFAT